MSQVRGYPRDLKTSVTSCFTLGWSVRVVGVLLYWLRRRRRLCPLMARSTPLSTGLPEIHCYLRWCSGGLPDLDAPKLAVRTGVGLRWLRWPFGKTQLIPSQKWHILNLHFSRDQPSEEKSKERHNSAPQKVRNTSNHGIVLEEQGESGGGGSPLWGLWWILCG